MAYLQRIKNLAESKGISIRELAERVGVKENQIHVMCRTNSTKIDTLEKIANVLGVSVTTFFDDTSNGDYFEQHGDRALMAKTIQHLELDQRNIGEERTTEVKEVAEEIVLPSACPDDAKHALTLLKSQVSSLRELIAEKDARIAEKNETIAELRERINELKSRT